MPNIINGDGLQVKTRAELVTEFTTALKAIYGDDIFLDSSTPDGQMMNIFIQAVLDLEDLLVQVYNSFDPDTAIGNTLIERCAINGVIPKGGTFTITNVTIIVDRALNLAGLDAEINNPDGTGYTVADNAGNQYILAESQVIAAAGTYVYAFRAKNPGAVLTVPNTIQTPVTVVLGVTSINNPTIYTSLGVNQETDAELRIRRQQSTALSSQGYLAGLLAALLNIEGVTSAFVYENTGGSTDGDGVPSHSIWVIVQGGAAGDIGAAIYAKRNAGCGMKGDEVVDITQPDGSIFQVKYDIVEPEDLYIEFDATSMNGVDAIDDANIKAELVLRLVPGVNVPVNVNELATIVQEIDSNCLVTNAGFSLDGMSYSDYLATSAKNKQFAVAAARISITDI